MINLIRVDDDTDHGGKVVTGSTRMRNDGRFVARKSDMCRRESIRMCRRT